MAQPSTVGKRVQHILDKSKPKNPPSILGRAGVCAALCLLVAFSSGVLAQDPVEEAKSLEESSEPAAEKKDDSKIKTRVFRLPKGEWSQAAGETPPLDFLRENGIEFRWGGHAFINADGSQLTVGIDEKGMRQVEVFLSDKFSLTENLLVHLKLTRVAMMNELTGEALIDAMIEQGREVGEASAVMGVLTARQFEQLVGIVEKTKTTKILAKPSVYTRSGIEAKIQIGDQAPLVQRGGSK